MLVRANRLLRGDDFRKIMRTGKKSSTGHLVGYQLLEADQPTRFGFVVSKACGGAVKRNQLKRRLRAMARKQLALFPVGSQVVIRCLPGSSELDYPELALDFDKVFGL
jgi:ribonuclease P protein component